MSARVCAALEVASTLALASMVAVAGVSAQSRVDGPLGELDVLTHEEWRGEGPGFRTRLTYRWIFDGRMLEAANEVLNEEGGVIARYHGAYTWDEGRGEIAFWTAAESGEVHRGRAWWRDGVLWHEAEVSGGGIAAYASALRPGAGRLEYFAAYGERRAGPELLRGEPIVYVPSRDDGESDPLQIGGEVVIRAAPADVWAALTTPDGLAGWTAPGSRVELRLGGTYELYFTPDAPDRGTEGTRVLAFIPNELLVTTGEAANRWSVESDRGNAAGVSCVGCRARDDLSAAQAARATAEAAAAAAAAGTRALARGADGGPAGVALGPLHRPLARERGRHAAGRGAVLGLRAHDVSNSGGCRRDS